MKAILIDAKNTFYCACDRIIKSGGKLYSKSERKP